MAVRPEGADYQWRKIPPGELSIDPEADERLGMRDKPKIKNSKQTLGRFALERKSTFPGVKVLAHGPSLNRTRWNRTLRHYFDSGLCWCPTLDNHWSLWRRIDAADRRYEGQKFLSSVELGRRCTMRDSSIRPSQAMAIT
jgi:hypothetical protein